MKRTADKTTRAYLRWVAIERFLSRLEGPVEWAGIVGIAVMLAAVLVLAFR